MNFVFGRVPHFGALIEIARLGFNEVTRSEHEQEFGVGAADRIKTSLLEPKLLAIVNNFDPETVIRGAVF